MGVFFTVKTQANKLVNYFLLFFIYTMFITNKEKNL